MFLQLDVLTEVSEAFRSEEVKDAALGTLHTHVDNDILLIGSYKLVFVTAEDLKDLVKGSFAALIDIGFL